jgi:hypothetical protein
MTTVPNTAFAACPACALVFNTSTPQCPRCGHQEGQPEPTTLVEALPVALPVPVPVPRTGQIMGRVLLVVVLAVAIWGMGSWFAGSHKYVGRWQMVEHYFVAGDHTIQITYEFRGDGTGTYDMGGGAPFDLDWQRDGDDHIIIRLHTSGGSQPVRSRAVVSESGDYLTLSGVGDSGTYQRIAQ